VSAADVLGYCQCRYGAVALAWGGFYDDVAAACGVDRVLDDLLGVW
jgi:CO dehydrogenase/acetyl-CoA synthase alpha subunit